MHTQPGSSPLSRGIPLRQRCLAPIQGIIPALAGNTSGSSMKSLTWTDHPRSRGEYDFDVEELPQLAGSSPLSRGILPCRQIPHHFNGIIPALAGNTATMKVAHFFIQDHPRSRGEYATNFFYHHRGIGSSPLSRGIRKNTCSTRHP